MTRATVHFVFHQKLRWAQYKGSKILRQAWFAKAVESALSARQFFRILADCERYAAFHPKIVNLFVNQR